MKNVLAFMFLLALLLPAGCGTVAYQYRWMTYDPPATSTALEGRWKGRWTSTPSGHSGGLRCIMTRKSDEVYRAAFHSTYARILTFPYTGDFEVSEKDGVFQFTGQKDLGRLAGGVYRYQGAVEGDDFKSTYRADNGDHGVFELKRVK